MKEQLRDMAYAGLKASGRIRRTPGISVLTYHSIDDSGSSISTSESEFQSQMEWLAAAGYRTVTMADLVTRRTRGLPDREPLVALTFDDAYESVYKVGFPIMEGFGFRGTVFAPAAYLGTHNRWVIAKQRGPLMPLMEWGAVRVMADAGFEIGSHTLTHRRLTELPIRDVRRELHDSRSLLEDELGRPVLSFAYPFGQYDETGMAEVERAGYTCACTTEWGQFCVLSDPLAIRRLSVGWGTSMARFTLLVSSSAWLLAALKTQLFHSG
jgi:peptidoglycan/xylan/chitin deacetylase (PgdA/CDA1 family)